MNYAIMLDGFTVNIIVAEPDVAAELSALPVYDGCTIGEPYSPPYTPAPEEDRDAMLVDLECRTTLLELGVI